MLTYLDRRIALIALLVLFLSRHHFESSTPLGQIAFGMIFGGIAGNPGQTNYGATKSGIINYVTRAAGRAWRPST